MNKVGLGSIGITVSIDDAGAPVEVTFTREDGSTVVKPYGNGEFDMHRAVRLVIATGGYTPLSLPSLHAWYDGSKPWTMTLTSGAVSTWRDLSGFGRDVTQATEARRPLPTGSINGVPAVTFAGTDDFLFRSYSPIVGSGSDAPFTFFVVCKPASVATTQIMLYIGSVANDTTQLRASFTSADWQVLKRDDATTIKSGVGGTPTAAPHIMTVIGHGTTATVRVDGVEVVSAADIDLGAATLDRIVLGAAFGASAIAGPYSGDLGEVIVSEVAVDAFNVAKCEAYLAAKWGIAIV